MLQSKQLKKGTQIVVHANSCTYKGELIGMTETELYLKTPTRIWTLPIDRINHVKNLDTIQTFGGSRTPRRT
ncbi:MAG: hypothetical protein COV44_10260 [Deltaproteobacteria bacterium CG11_big_fil_rev_8_21_14_0_20_45_16]|nr:MAG: hypothetical protein COV44_10260 [Deltaproteobacteria bacterium CG11_big_fil_rev_8_21_14_0_20_45_16]